MITTAQFLMTRSATILSLLQRRSNTFGQDCPDRVQDLIRSSRSGLPIWDDKARDLRSDVSISNRCSLLLQDTIVVQMSVTVPIKDTHDLNYDLTQ